MPKLAGWGGRFAPQADVAEAWLLSAKADVDMRFRRVGAPRKSTDGAVRPLGCVRRKLTTCSVAPRRRSRPVQRTSQPCS